MVTLITTNIKLLEKTLLKDINYNWNSLGNFPHLFISLHNLLYSAL
jgi:hypothetical protein